MQTSVFATKAFEPRTRVSSIALISLVCLVAFGFFAANMVSVQTLSIAENSVSTVSTSIAYFGSQAIGFVAQSSSALIGLPAVGQFYFGELILASVLVPVVIYIASATFPGAITAASNANESGWSSTNKTLWNNVFPLMAVVAAILLPIAWVVLPLAGGMAGRGAGGI